MNDQNRETKKFSTPSGKEVEMKTYLTARERNAIRGVFLSGMKIDTSKIDPANDSKAAVTEISGDLFEKSREKLLEVALVSFEGSTEKVMDRILDGAPEDYDFIAKQADLIGKENLIVAK